MVATSLWPLAVVAFALIAFSKTVITGAVVSAVTVTAGVAPAQMALAEARQTVRVEHLQCIATSASESYILVAQPTTHAQTEHDV